MGEICADEVNCCEPSEPDNEMKGNDQQSKTAAEDGRADDAQHPVRSDEMTKNRDERDAIEDSHAKSAHARISKAERRRQKKGGEIDVDPNVTTTVAEPKAAAPAKKSAPTAASAKPAPLPRGQKSKAK